MLKITLLCGLILVVIGILGFALSATYHWTALIPAVWGAVLCLSGGFALVFPPARKPLMHFAVVCTFVGLLGGLSISGPKILQILSGQEISRPTAVLSQLAMTLVCLGHFISAVRFFLRARKNLRSSFR